MMEELELGEINANVYQIARLNSMLHQGFRFEPIDNIKELNSAARMIPAQKRSSVVDPAPENLDKPNDKIKTKKETVTHPPPANKVESKTSNKSKKSTQSTTNGQSSTSTKTVPPNSKKTSTNGYDKIEQVLNLLKDHVSGKQFMTPFSGVPTSEALDLSIIGTKLKTRQYSSLNFFASDIRKLFNSIWQNSSPASEIYISATELCLYFENLIKDMGDVLIEPNSQPIINTKAPVKPASKPKLSQESNKSSKQAKEKPLSKEEKALLKVSIMKLPPNMIPGLIPIIQNDVDLSNSRDTLEFDIDTLPIKTCRRMEEYVCQCREKISKRGVNEKGSLPVIAPLTKTAKDHMHTSPPCNLNDGKRERIKTKNISNSAKEETKQTLNHSAKECFNNLIESEESEVFSSGEDEDFEPEMNSKKKTTAKHKERKRIEPHSK